MNSPHIGVDISSAVDPRPSGVARYIQSLVSALAALSDGPRLTLLCRPSRRRISDPRALFPDLPVEWWTPLTPMRSFDLIHGLDLRLPRMARARLVVTIHDLSALERTDHASADFLRRKRAGYARAGKRAHSIITHTEVTRRAIVAELGVDPERVTAVHLAAVQLAAVQLAAQGGPEAGDLDLSHDRNPVQNDSADRLLLVGGPSRRKGSHLLPALTKFWSDNLSWHPRFAWVGSAPEEEIDSYRGSLPAELAQRIEFLGHVSDAQLQDLYRQAQGLLVLSDTEGFGMTLLEAAQARCPVLALRSDPLEEVLGDAAFWFSTDSELSAERFRGFLDSDQRREMAQQAAARARSFSWEKTARQTLEVYSQVLSQRRG